MYKPNFCCECGERVGRPRWRVWTSRRFCPACEVRFRKGRVAAPALAAACLLTLGFALGRGLGPGRPPAVIVRGESPAAEGGVRRAAPGRVGAGGVPVDNEEGARYGADGTAAERPTDPAEVVSICGARTKKGTPCSRRVRGTGRCWQHRGLPAMLPPGKLVVPN